MTLIGHRFHSVDVLCIVVCAPSIYKPPIVVQFALHFNTQLAFAVLAIPLLSPTINGISMDDLPNTQLEQAILKRKVAGDADEEIVLRLVDNGFEEASARRLVIDTVAKKLQAGEKLYKKLRKTEAMLDVHRQLRALNHKSLVAQVHEISPQRFFLDYYVRNTPVLLSGLINHWPACRRWSFEYFKAFASSKIEVMTGRATDSRYELNRDERRESMLFGEFLDRLESAGQTNDIYLTASNYALRDWLPELVDDLENIPGLLVSPDPGRMNLWIGPAGTVTQLHHDNTNVLLVQISGQKVVHLVPSLELHLTYNSESSISPVDPREPQMIYPLARSMNVMCTRVKAGECLFIPVGWWHRVESLSPSISLSCSNFEHPNHYVMYNP